MVFRVFAPKLAFESVGYGVVFAILCVFSMVI